jgi:hypothetical protein
MTGGTVIMVFPFYLSLHKNTRLPQVTAHAGVRHEEGAECTRVSRLSFAIAGNCRLTGAVIWRETAQVISPLDCTQTGSKSQDERTNLLSGDYVLRPGFSHGLATEKIQKEPYPFVSWQNMSNYGFKTCEGAPD